eukprot:Rhum_TRINITY_DN1061_c0_g1::Rhum_TRINITY_DN1061_c0_g1_i1::g.3209::m.3209
MFRSTTRAMMTARSVAVDLKASKPASKYHAFIEKEPDTEADLGARNEAAYFNYEAFQPKDLKTKYAMPSLNNLMTSVVGEVVFIAGVSIGVGILSWIYLCSQKYETVALSRPKAQDE